MVLHLPASFALRPRRAIPIVALGLILTATAGCGNHRRSSLRPMFVAPARVPSAVIAPSCPTPVEPAPVGVPAATPSLGDTSLPPLDDPVVPAETSPVSPPRPRAVPGPAPGAGTRDEPPLESLDLSPANGRPPSASPGAMRSRGTSSRTPAGTSLNNGRRGLFGRPRQASLRERLRPFVNDPEDLFTPPKADRPWKYVVLHHSAHATGGYDEIDREHRKVLGWEGCGYHFVIGNGTGSPDGQVEVAQRWSNQKHGVHCRDGKTSEVNEYGIGICLVGDLDDSPPTPRQVEAAQALVAYLGDHYAIPAERIGTHASLASSPTACPGKHFPSQVILNARDFAQR